jgi:hypothetical protein
MPDGSQPCPYRASHEWDSEGICRNCFAKRPTPNPYGWVASQAERVADEPLVSDITPERISSLIQILNWEELTKLRTQGLIDIVGTPDRIIIERVDSKWNPVHPLSILDDGPP